MLTNISFAQNQNEIKVSYGLIVSPNLQIQSLRSQGQLYNTLLVSYNYFIKERVSIGMQLNYSSLMHPNDALVGTQSNLLNLFSRFDYYHVKRDNFQAYSGLIVATDSRSILKTVYFNLLGLRFGKKHAFFTELGMGITAGYSATF